MGLVTSQRVEINKNIVTGTEYKLPYKIDNKNLYVKRLDCGSLPNNSTKEISIGLDISIITIIGIMGYMYNSSINYGWLIPNGNASNQVHVEFSGDKIIIVTAADRSSYRGYLTIFYTKNS